jgi:hypothetical protein
MCEFSIIYFLIFLSTTIAANITEINASAPIPIDFLDMDSMTLHERRINTSNSIISIGMRLLLFIQRLPYRIFSTGQGMLSY